MTKDDDLPAASGGAPSRRALQGHGRKTAPIGTPVQKFPLEIPVAAPPPVTPMPVAPVRSDRPPSSSQNTLSSPRTVGGHTARLLRGERLDDDEPESIDPSRAARPRVQDRSARARPPLDEDEETLSRNAKAKAEADSVRGGTLRMDAVDAPASVRAAPAPAAGRKAPPVVTPPLSPDPVSEDPPSTARGGSARDFHDVPVYSAKPAPVLGHPAAAPPAHPVAASPAPPVVASAPMGEITITASEFESTAVPQEAIESRWPFAFALGAVSLAVGSLLPLPFRQYIVPDRGAAVAGTTAPVASAAPVVAGPDLLRTAAPLPRAVTATPPPSLTTSPVGVTPPATSAVRPLPFGTAKPRPTSTTPRDVF
jgi:hypothetical protein